jgi:hypothetical protein
MTIGLIGGTGFVGQHLTTILEELGHTVYVFSRSELKMSFLGQQTIKRKIDETTNTSFNLLVNLAFPNSPSVLNARRGVDRLFDSINIFISKNKVERFIHISSIALDPAVRDNTTSGVYEYVKDYQEKKALSLRSLTKVTTVRLGNVLGLGSPWYELIIDSFLRGDYIALKGAYSNAVHVNQIAEHLSQNKFDSLTSKYNYAPLSDYKWSELLPAPMKALVGNEGKKKSIVQVVKSKMIGILGTQRFKYNIDLMLSKFGKTIYDLDKEKLALESNPSEISDKKESYSRVFYFAKALDDVLDEGSEKTVGLIQKELINIAEEVC